MKTKAKAKKLVQVKAYFPEGDRVVERIGELAKKTGLPVSRVVAMSIQAGLPKIESSLSDVSELLENKK